MNDFNEFDASVWQPDGVLEAVYAAVPNLVRKVARSWSWVITAAALTCAVAPGALDLKGSGTAAWTLEEHSSVSSDTGGDAVPNGYWQTLLKGLHGLPVAVEAPGQDPEPFI